MPKCKCANPMFLDRANLMADTSTDDNPAESFTLSVGDLACNIRTISGDETYRGQSLEAHVSHVVTMPWRSGVTADMRLVVTNGIYNTRILNIESVRPQRPDGSRLPYLEIYCKELEP